MPTPTQALQLIFSPTDPLCINYGRFSQDVPGGSLNQRSKVWISNTGTVSHDSSLTVQILRIDPNTPLIQICVIGNLTGTGYTWADGPEGYCLRITAVFGRSHHGTQREQAYASPFSKGNQNSTSLATVFDQHYSATAGNSRNYPVITNNQGVLTLGNARFHSAPPPQLQLISPNTYYSQSPGPYTITGQNLLGATVQWSAGSSATVISHTATQIMGMLTVPDVNSPESGSVSVTYDGETSNSLTFSIQPSPDLSDEPAEPGAEGNAGNGSGSRTVGSDIYEFNVGVVAYVSNVVPPTPATVQELTLGHDPDLDVGM